MNLERYFSLEYLVEFGYFDFKPPLKSFSGEYILSQTFYKKIFNCNMLSKNLEKILKEVDFKFYEDTIPIEFTIYKNDDARRIYKMPNIYSYICLSKHLIKYKDKYIPIIERSEKSLSKFFYSKSFLDNSKIRDKNRFGRRYIFATDIQEFYPSIYTHSISWVLVGKEVAKEKKAIKTLYYNELDSLIQRCQYGETHGIPMGTFASRLISEIYMCNVDEKLKNYRYLRYVDDFEFAYNNEIEQANFYNDICKVLKDINLKVKIEKNEKDSFPFKVKDNGVKFFTYFNEEGLYNKPQQYQLSKIHNFINFSLTQEKKGQKGALKLMFLSIKSAIEENKLKKSTIYKTIIERLLNIVLMRPILVSYFLDLIDTIDDTSVIFYTKEVIRDNINIIEESIKMYINLGHNEELYSTLCIIYFVEIDILKEDDLLNIIKNMDDFNVILAIEIYEKKDILNWERLFNILEIKLKKSNKWEDEFWLLKYEIFYKIKHKKKSIFTRQYQDYLYSKYGSSMSKTSFLQPPNLKKLDTPLVFEVQYKNSNNKISKFYQTLIKKQISFLHKNSI